MESIASLLARALDASWTRHEFLASNLANADTPGFKRQDIDFQSYLQSALRPGITVSTTHPRHISSSGHRPLYVTRDSSSLTPDGNNVDVDREMAEVSANALYYTAVLRQLGEHMSMLRRAITEGRR
ncbi:MAG: flagellar basal body rod protein FlgB [Firmicutes bacterium]|nr:flagellar basal body rod protein FlgB [Candidatus Fermentithermobacillaceae bacterium]